MFKALIKGKGVYSGLYVDTIAEARDFIDEEKDELHRKHRIIELVEISDTETDEVLLHMEFTKDSIFNIFDE